MVRSVSSLGSNSSNNLILSNMLRDGKNSVRNGLKKTQMHIDLPSKIAWSAMGIYGTGQIIGDSKVNRGFLMTCSEYESSGECPLFGPNCNPYP